MFWPRIWENGEEARLRLRRQVKLANWLAWWQLARHTQQAADTGLRYNGKGGTPFGFIVRFHAQKLPRKHDYFKHFISDPCLQ